jgi:hypothetical protein
MRVCVFCASSTRIDQRHVALATDLGTTLGERGHDLVSGGGSVSSMGAVATAVRAAGGHTIGVIPQALVDLEVADDLADELLVTETMRERKALMDAKADAFLVLPGGIGTLEELFEIWTARTLGLHDKPIVILDPEGVLAPVRELVAGLVESRFARPVVTDAVVWAVEVDAAVDAIEAAVRAAAQPTVEERLEAEPG